MERFYTPLYSGQSHAIFSMAGGFSNRDFIANVYKLYKEMAVLQDVDVQWDLSLSGVSPNVVGSGESEIVSWKSTCVVNGLPVSVLFSEDDNFNLFVKIDGNLIVTLSDRKRPSYNDYKKIFKALGGIK